MSRTWELLVFLLVFFFVFSIFFPSPSHQAGDSSCCVENTTGLSSSAEGAAAAPPFFEVEFRLPTTSDEFTSRRHTHRLHRCKELCRAIFNGALAFGFLLHGHRETSAEFRLTGWRCVRGAPHGCWFFSFFRFVCRGGLQTSCSSPIKGPILPLMAPKTFEISCNFMPQGIRSASQLRSSLRTLLNPQKMNLKCCKTSPLVKSKKHFLTGKNWRVHSET